MERPVPQKEHFFDLYFLRRLAVALGVTQGKRWGHTGKASGSVRQKGVRKRLELLLGFAQGKIKRMDEFE